MGYHSDAAGQARRRFHAKQGFEGVMAAFTAKDVSELRQKTGAGMMECKKALEENNGDMQKAMEHLRAKGIAKAEKRAGKQTSEGPTSSYIHNNGKDADLVEVNCQTALDA